ncbi:MAG: NAD(P)-binding domain-containing protein, partial [Bacteroidales bacterium]|nr:NAD(P)-binding domain-containing protein [Bacteroidales bacterium]
MIPKKILIVDSVHQSLSEQLNEYGFICETNKKLSYQDFYSLSDDYYGLIIRSCFVVDEPLLLKKKNLKFIVRIGSGVENIDTEACARLGIECLSTPEGNAPSVAEHALGLLLSALKNIPVANNQIREGIWDRHGNKGRELSARTVGIIGYGHTGPAFAKLLHAMGCSVYAYDRFKTGFSDEYATETSLETILDQCDVISLHINYLPENHYFINKSLLDRIKKKVIFINTSRGLSVNTNDLLDALDADKLSCVCMDVLEFEST